MKTKGFTLIELLVVISIIGVLSTIVIGSITNARQKANITKTAAMFKDIERGLFAATLEEGRSTYWTVAELGASGNSTLAQMLAIEYPNPGWAISNYVSSNYPGSLRYYNSGSNINPCSASASGVVFRTPSYSLEDRLALNRAIDGNESETNPNSTGGVECGKFSPRTIITTSSYALYRLSRNSNIIDF